MARAHHVLLVPGFFGFANLGDFAYFGHVRDFLAEFGPAVGLRGEVRVVRTIPTASLPKRAVLLAEAIADVLRTGGGVASVIGHSSGGIDARLVVSPGVALPAPFAVEPVARAVRAVVTIATPHHGTPLAHGFSGALGQQLLRLLSLSTMHALRAGRLPIGVVLRLARLLRGRAAPASVVDQLFVQLLGDFSKDRRRAIEEFFASLGNDQDLVAQLTPAGMDVFNASTQDRASVRYGCVVTQARPPTVRSFLRAGLDPYAHATHAVFIALRRIVSKTPLERFPRVTREQAAALRATFGRVPDVRANDGIVPTLSQVWGDVVAATWADHHDVIGHFHGPTHVPPHFDWLASGTGFDRPRFEAVWREVAAFVASAAA